MKQYVVVAAVVAAAAALTGPAWASGDPAPGKALFRTICTLCHSNAPDQNKIGPTLFGVVGRRSGVVPGYSYSDANRNSGIVWTEAVLDKYRSVHRRSCRAPRWAIPARRTTRSAPTSSPILRR